MRVTHRTKNEGQVHSADSRDIVFLPWALRLNKMRLFIIIIIFFMFSGQLMALNIAQCKLSFHIVNESGGIEKNALLSPDNIVKVENIGIDDVSGFTLWHVKLSEEGKK